MAKLIIILSFLFFPVSVMANVVPTFTVFYTSFEVVFFVPPTPEDIEKYGLKISNLSSIELVWLFEEVDKDLGGPDNNCEHCMIRIKIIKNNSKKEIYITQDKKVVTQDKKIVTGWKKFKIDKRTANAALNVIFNIGCSQAKNTDLGEEMCRKAAKFKRTS